MKVYAVIRGSSCSRRAQNRFGAGFANSCPEYLNYRIFHSFSGRIGPPMEPRLIALAGPLKGTTILLTDVETIIGRDPGNTVAINDPLVSRRHCCIRNETVRRSFGNRGSI